MDEIRESINNHADFARAGEVFRQAQMNNPSIPKVIIFKEVAKEHSYEFHKKLFALMNFAYENTTLPEKEYKGEMITQSLDTFRKELVVLSGFYTADVTGKGDIRFIPDSLSYTKCPDSKKAKIYDSMLDVVARLLGNQGYDRKKLEELSKEWSEYI